MNRKRFFWTIGILVVAGLGYVWSQLYSKNTEFIATATYACDAHKTITAKFYRGEAKPTTSPDTPPIPGGSVALVFSDGRTMTLKQTLSADGGRYANQDESLVFWDKGNRAIVLESGEEKSFTGCVSVANVAQGQTTDLSQVYASSTAGFSVHFPKDYRVDESYQYQDLGPGKTISGVRFTIPPALAAGTNLSADSYISVERMPQAKDCFAPLFLQQKTFGTLLTEGSTTYSIASSSDAAAGNRYEETVYALFGTNPCIAVRYFIHYGVFENYPAGKVREFSAQAILREFDAIRRTLVVAQ